MEKVRENYHKTYSGIRVSRMDLKQLVEVIAEKSHISGIEAGKWKLQGIDEVDKLKDKEILPFSVEASEPYIHLHLSQTSSSLFVNSPNDLEMLGLGTRLDSILKRNGAEKEFLHSNWLAFVWPVIIWIAAYVFIFRSKLVGLVIGVIGLAVPMVALSSILFYFHRSCRIKRSETSLTAFFKRNGDKIIIVILSAVIGSALTLLISWITRR
jgi:hypothetical protein